MANKSEQSSPLEHGASQAEGPSLEELRPLWDVPSFALAVVDRQCRILRANSGFASLVAWKPDAIPGRTLREAIPLAGPQVEALVDKVIASGEPALGMLTPFDWAELTFDVLAIGAGTEEPRAIVVISDPRHRPIDAPDGASGARFAFFDLTRRMARATVEQAAVVIEEALRFAAERYRLERAYVRLLADDEVNYYTPYEYHRPDLPPLAIREVTVASIAWANEKFLRGEIIVLSSPDDLPADDKGFRAALARVSVRATISVPIVDGPRLLGYVAYPASEGRRWGLPEVNRLRLLGEIIAAVVVRTRAEEDLRDRVRFEETLSAAAMRFVDIAAEHVDAEIQRMLDSLATLRKLDRVMVVQLDAADAVASVTHDWCAPGVASARASFAGRRVEELSPVVRRALAGEAVGGRMEDAAPGSELEDLLRQLGVHAFVFAPIYIEGRVKGVMVVQVLSHRWRGPPSHVVRAKLVADVISAALSHRAARERVRRWERRFAQILESAMDGVILLDASGVVRDWTAQATTIFGKAREEMLGKELGTVIHADDRFALSTKIVMTAGAASAAQRFELRGLRADGCVVPIELSMTPLEQSEGSLIAAFVRDITDRKRIEAEKQRAFEEVSRQKRTLERERDYLREEHRPGTILGESRAIKRAVELVDAVAETASSVLLLGESGVGKEVFAAAVHARSARASGPFVKVNCASVPGSLFESEFFGHAKGSFTGAVKDRVGRFELADGGTLFLDEVGEIPIELQAKLLRVLQEGEIERVGEDRTRKLDVRIVAATNRDLTQEIEAGRFRRDLYFRLSVFPIAIPRLRDREGDVLVLARYFLARHMARARREGLALSPDDEARLLSYDWPGNVRELDHVIERAVILSRAPPLRMDLALPYRGARSSSPPEILREDDLRRLERENLALALKKAGGRVSGAGGAAELLGMHPSTLRDRMKAFGLSRSD